MKRLTNREVGMRLKSGRAAKGYTLQQVADLVGVDRSTVQRYETGGIVLIKRPVVESICASLELNPAWVMGESEERYVQRSENAENADVLEAARRLEAVPAVDRAAIITRLLQDIDRYFEAKQ